MEKPVTEIPSTEDLGSGVDQNDDVCRANDASGCYRMLYGSIYRIKLVAHVFRSKLQRRALISFVGWSAVPCPSNDLGDWSQIDFIVSTCFNMVQLCFKFLGCWNHQPVDTTFVSFFPKPEPPSDQGIHSYVEGHCRLDAVTWKCWVMRELSMKTGKKRHGLMISPLKLESNIGRLYIVLPSWKGEI